MISKDIMNNAISLITALLPFLIAIFAKTDVFLGFFDLKRKSIEKFCEEIFIKIKLLKKKNLKSILNEQKEVDEIPDTRLSDIIDEKDRIAELERSIFDLHMFQGKYFQNIMYIITLSVFITIILILGIILKCDFAKLFLPDSNGFICMVIYSIVYIVLYANFLDKKIKKVKSQNRSISDPRENLSNSTDFNFTS